MRRNTYRAPLPLSKTPLPCGFRWRGRSCVFANAAPHVAHVVAANGGALWIGTSERPARWIELDHVEVHELLVRRLRGE